MVKQVLGRVALVLGLVLASVLLSGGVASAGGPTSVLLVAPQQNRAAALYHSDQNYQRLESLLGLDGATATAKPSTAFSSPYITATWLVHDVNIWRIDRIFLDAAGGSWVVSQTLDSGEPIADGMFPGGTGSADAVWHQVGDPAALRDLLTELRLIGPGTAAASPAAAVIAAPPVPPAPPATTVIDGWWWAALGLMGGIAATLLGTRRRRPGLAADPDEPALVVQDRM